MEKMIKYNSNRFSENEKNTLNNFIRENKDKKIVDMFMIF